MGHGSSECMCVLSSYCVFPTVMDNYTSPQLPYLYVYVCVLSSLSVFPTVMGNHTSPQLPYLNVCVLLSSFSVFPAVIMHLHNSDSYVMCDQAWLYKMKQTSCTDILRTATNANACMVPHKDV